MTNNEMKEYLMGIVKKYGNTDHIGHKYHFDIDDDEIDCIAWTYWDDNDDTHYDDDGYIKELYALFINDRDELVCLWDGNFGEKYDSLEDELQEYIYDCIASCFLEC